MKENGEPYREHLRQYLPQNIFKHDQLLWNEQAQLDIIRQYYFACHKSHIKINYVVYVEKPVVLKIKRIEEVPEEWECGICREGKDERPVIQLRCGGDHIFHSICAKEWGKTKRKRDEKTTCPMCVRVVSSTASQEPESQQTPIGMDTTE